MRKLVIILLILYCYGGYAQGEVATKTEEVTKKDVKVGLVLSGGGAKGLAHIRQGFTG